MTRPADPPRRASPAAWIVWALVGLGCGREHEAATAATAATAAEPPGCAQLRARYQAQPPTNAGACTHDDECEAHASIPPVEGPMGAAPAEPRAGFAGRAHAEALDRLARQWHDLRCGPIGTRAEARGKPLHPCCIDGQCRGCSRSGY
ncbi:MAG: hypothetical protein KDK70_19195 [Myxococcales bacterium]|nr:hypothetical protein [Myxococcales bacterium]